MKRIPVVPTIIVLMAVAIDDRPRRGDRQRISRGEPPRPLRGRRAGSDRAALALCQWRTTLVQPGGGPCAGRARAGRNPAAMPRARPASRTSPHAAPMRKGAERQRRRSGWSRVARAGCHGRWRGGRGSRLDRSRDGKLDIVADPPLAGLQADARSPIPRTFPTTTSPMRCSGSSSRAWRW